MLTNMLNLSIFVHSDIVFAMHTRFFRKVSLNLICLLVEQMEKILTLLYHIFLIFINEYRSHDKLVKSMKILFATFINSLFLPYGYD